MEANKLTEDYILEYLDKLEQSLNNQVSKSFKTMEQRIQTVDNTLTKIENQFELQDNQVSM